ncbi:MAG: transcription termination factor NusA [Candidatus Omnitrophica bacterium]|nr:transcription termination factor NusA [Candidatus Omnitrophota bacterium]
MNGALLTALERIEREKGISKDILFAAIESALVSAARKVIDDPDISKEDITVTMDQETGEITVFSEGEVVENERFGRIAAQTAKQVIIQKIREAERDVIFEKYEKKVGSIVSGGVHRFEKGNVIVELDDTEALLPKSGQIPRERFRQGEQIRAYLQKVERGTSGPEIILSRTDEGFVKKLFELEVPEISQGIVEIKSIAREAGERTKIAVSSKEEKVDPVGACVGMRGSRVRDIVRELHGERIDIVRWDDDIRTYLKTAVSPAEISQMVVDRESKTITLVVPQDQLSLLIGKKGRNIRLASKLLGWELIAESTEVVWEIPITEVQGIGEKTLKTLEGAGFDSVEKVLQSGAEGLLELDGVGQKTAEKIIAACEDAAAQVEAQEAEEAAEKESEASQEEAVEEAPEEEAAEEAEQPKEPEEEMPEEQGKTPAEEEAAEEVPEEETSEEAEEEKAEDETPSEEETREEEKETDQQEK